VAFDVYVGTMTRYYRREWENVTQKIAREQGMKYTMVYVGGQPDPPPASDLIRQAVERWCNALSGELSLRGFGPMEWSETDDQPYFTDRPGWPGYTALLVWAAHAEHPELPCPTNVPQSWLDDPAFLKSAEHGFATQFGTILDAKLWVPTDFPFVLEATALGSDEKTRIGSVFTLKKQLDVLHGRTFQRFAHPTQSSPQSPPPKTPSFLARLFGRKGSDAAANGPDLAETAEFSLELFRNLAAKACDHRLPILLDF
jgi:hypothetical protein